MRNYKLLNNLVGWIIFLIAATTYLLTIEPTASFWDCGEFITTSYKLEVGHPPGAPFFMILGRFFTLFGGPESAGLLINSLSALASAFTILFLFWTITHIAQKIVSENKELTKGETLAILGSGIVGALAYTFSDSFWFSAVEGEVYATSSLITAVIFWAILKWEDVADKPYANRWLVLIAYIIGLSIGVHLLNLLAIPAIVFVYYFKKYTVTRNGILKAIAVSIFLLGLVMYGIIPGTVKIGSLFELLFVNSFGLPYHSGLLFYIAGVIALIIFGIRYTSKKKKVFWNTAILMITAILIGYSSFTLTIIRSSSKTPMDQNSPNNTFALLSYLNREQYGERPLLTGQYFNSPNDVNERFTEGKSVYSQRDGKYVVTDKKISANYDSKFTTIFPRMWSNNEPAHAEEYKTWARIKGTKIRHKNEQGEVETIVKPTMAENLRFFFRYQVGHMYFRYFMWNFAGRQNDIQSHGSMIHGNWISGIPFIDNWRLGDQSLLPTSLKSNKARNTYFLLPLLLGIVGIFYLYNRGKLAKKWLWVIFLLFFLTGLAIVIYLNQYPMQPRERDYAYAASFYAFSIWIGFGVLGLFKFFKKYLPEVATAGLITIITTILVPGIMASENWDDHDRSGRYTARDLGANYLKSCAENAILFTNGDNDTFPLWYNQEVEGTRTDVRVCNLSYLQTDWYINQMKLKAYESEPVPFSMDQEKYTQGTRDIVYLMDDPRMKGTIDLKKAIEFVASDDPKTKLTQYDNAAYIPGKIFTLKIDKEAVIRNKVVRPEDYDKILDTMVIDLSNKNYIAKDELMVLDLLANSDWERPIYFAITVGSKKHMNLEDYFQVEGFAYRVVPIKSTAGSESFDVGNVASDIMYENLMNKFEWGNMNQPGIYLDENNRRMMTNIRNSFNRLATTLIKEGKNDSAKAVVNRCLELVPHDLVPFEYFGIELIDNVYMLKENEKADELVKAAYINFKEELEYALSLDSKMMNTRSIGELFQRDMFFLQRLDKTCQRFSSNEELKQEINSSLEGFFKSFSSIR